MKTKQELIRWIKNHLQSETYFLCKLKDGWQYTENIKPNKVKSYKLILDLTKKEN